MLDDYERAVDLAQEAFVRVFKNAERYQATYSFSTYIYRIAHNLAIGELRQRKRRRLIPLPTFFSTGPAVAWERRMIKIAPYGSWKSPITSDLIVAGTVRLGQIELDGEDVYWI